ncbi:MAG: VTT domain-containing protein [Pseudomonadota bacterium]
MNEWNDLDNPELKGLFRKHFLRGLVFLLVLVSLILLLALSFKPQIEAFAHWLIDGFGIAGIGAMVFIADLMISPVPPDFALLMLGRSELHSQWMILVPVLGLISTGAGICGWLVGQKLKHLRWVKRALAYFGNEHRRAIKKFGFWMVVLGALTPLPFSLTCWLAGIFKLSFKNFLIAALCRVPRFIIYYWAIFYSGELGIMIRDLF